MLAEVREAAEPGAQLKAVLEACALIQHQHGHHGTDLKARASISSSVAGPYLPVTRLWSGVRVSREERGNGRPGGNSGGTFVRGSVMAGTDGQGRLCHLTSQDGIGDDREGSTAAACAGLQNRWTALRVVGGFDSRPPPLTCSSAVSIGAATVSDILRQGRSPALLTGTP